MIESRCPDRDEPSDDPAEEICAARSWMSTRRSCRSRPESRPAGLGGAIAGYLPTADARPGPRCLGSGCTGSTDRRRRPTPGTCGLPGAAEPPDERVCRRRGAGAPRAADRPVLVLEWLDAGGQAQVFRVLHPELAKDFVLKLARRPIEREGDGEADPAGRDRLIAARGGSWPSATIPTWSGSSTSTSTKAGPSWSWSTSPA